MTKHHLENTEAIKKLAELAEEVKVCMLATVQEDGTILSRPMQTIEVDDEGTIWFFTNEFSNKAADISKENTVYLIYSHPGKNTYLHVKGTASVVDDSEKIKQLWSPAVKAWFPKGIDDPALSLLKVTTDEASYWDGSSSKFVVFFEMLKAVAKGKQYDKGEFGELTM